MRTNCIISILMLFSNITFSQKNENLSYQLTYDMFLNFDEIEQYNSQLLFNTNESYFVYKVKDSNDEEIKQDENDLTKFSFKISDNSSYYIRSSITENSVLQLTKNLNNSRFEWMEEEMPKINWEISDSTKMVNSYPCLKARGQFAGRIYTVWFTPELPNPFGPWKLHGLPGTILEATDALNEVKFFCTKIESIDELLSKYPSQSNYPKISKEEYLRERKKFSENLEKKLSTKMDRGLKIRVTTFNFKSIEIYEN